MPSVRIKENEYFDAALRRFKRACEKAGVICMCVPPALRHREIEYIMKKVEAVGIVIPLAFHHFNYFKTGTLNQFSSLQRFPV